MDQNFNNPYGNQFGGQNQFNNQYGGQNQFNAQYGNQYNNAYADQNPYAQANVQYNNQYSQFNAQYNNQYAQFNAQNAGFNAQNAQFANQYGAGFGMQGFQPGAGMGQAMPGRSGGPTSFSGIVSEVTETLQQKVVAKSFLYMVVALIVTAIAAFAAPQAMAKILITHPSAIFGLVGLELVIVIVSNIAIKKNNAALTVVLYTVYSFLTGATLGVVFWAYQLGSVVAIFLMTSAIFAIMAVYGMVTKRDLSSLGSILLMSILGIIIVSTVNILFLHSEGLELAISYLGVAIFIGFTAYDTQKIKQKVAYADSANTEVLALSGAFQLYLDFINIFIRLLSIMGRRK